MAKGEQRGNREAKKPKKEKPKEAAPAANWPEAVEKARYLLGLFAQSAAATDPRRRKLIDRVMADFDHLLDSSTTDGKCI